MAEWLPGEHPQDDEIDKAEPSQPLTQATPVALLPRPVRVKRPPNFPGFDVTVPVKGTRTTLLRQQANERTSSAKAAAVQHAMCAMVHQFPTPASHPHYYGADAIHATACQAIGQRTRIQ